MIKRSLFIVLLAAGLLAPAASASAQTAPPPQPGAQSAGSIGIGLLEAPVSEQNDPRAHIYIIDHVGQGTTISRRFQVVNTTTSPQTIDLYAGAASISNGSFVTAPGRSGNDVAQWTSVNPPLVTVAPGQSAQATVTITVPKNAEDGERYGVVWAEREAATGTGVNVVNRVGIRMYLSVGAGTAPASDFTIESLQAARDDKTHQPVVRAMVHNTGARALDMSGKLELKDGPGGLTAGPFPAELGTTLGIGQREPVTVKLDKQIPKGPWNAVITLRSGELEHSAQAQLVFPDSGAARPVKADSLAQKAKIFLPLLAIILALIVGLIIALRRRRKDDYAEVKRDLKRFEELVKAQEGGATIPGQTVDDPVVAIRAAIKQARRADDEKTAGKLEARLNALLERQAAIRRATVDAGEAVSVTKPEITPRSSAAGLREQEAAPPPPPPASSPAPTSPAPAAAGSSPQPASVAAPAPETTNGVHVNGNGLHVSADSERVDDASLAAILRVLATAPPGGQRFALVKAARQYGRNAIEDHPEELAALPEDVRIRLLRAAPNQPEPSEIA